MASSTDRPNGELSAADDGPSALRADGKVVARNQKEAPNMLASIAVIALGAALGAVLRWGLGNWLNARFANLPPGTLAANLLGGYLIGIAMAVFASSNLSPQWRLLTVTGFLGGLTTFSTFSAEVSTALLGGELGWAALTVLTHVIGSVMMTILGVLTVRLLRS